MYCVLNEVNQWGVLIAPQNRSMNSLFHSDTELPLGDVPSLTCLKPIAVT